MNKLEYFRSNTDQYNKCNNFIKAAYLLQALSVAYLNDAIDIMQSFGIYREILKQQGNRVNKEFDRFYDLLVKKTDQDSKMELAKYFDVMRHVLDDLFDSPETIEIEEVKEVPLKLPEQK